MKIECTPEEFQSLVKQNATSQTTTEQTKLPKPVFSCEELLSIVSRVEELVGCGEKIAAIRLVREFTMCGLKDAKDVVEGKYPTYVNRGY
jgi:ribosomal protein L7/L12